MKLLLTIFVFVLAAAAGVAVWYFRFQTYHFAVVKTGVLYRDGNRGVREFAHAVTRANIKTVVSLIDDRELNDPKKPQFADEAAWCAAHGVKQIRIPVKLGGWPTPADVALFLSVVDDPANRPVLVHYAQGVRRTGMFVAAYQLTTEHRSPAEVKADIQMFGHSARDTTDVERFIDLYRRDPTSMPTSMPVSAE